MTGDVGYRPGELQDKSPNPAWSGQIVWMWEQKCFLDGLSEFKECIVTMLFTVRKQQVELDMEQQTGSK